MERNAIIGHHTEPPSPPPPAEEVHYPDSDGKFLLQHITHSAQLISASEAIKQHFRDARVLVAVDPPLYWEEGNNRAVLAPDLMVTLDHELQGDRRTYQTWIEGRLPDFVLEVVSPASADDDKKLQMGTYEQLGIPEYFLYDPDASEPAERLLGYRLDQRTDKYGAPLQPGSDGALETPALGVSLRAEGARLIIRNTATGEDYLTGAALQRRLDEVRRQRKQFEAEYEALQREQAVARADQAEARAEQAEAENRRLKELLRDLERPPSQEP